MRRIALAVILLFGSAQVFAQTTAQRAQKEAAAQKQLADTRARIKKLAEEQRKIENERSAAAKALREADGKVSGSQRALHETDARIAEQELALEKLQQQKLALENSLSRQRAELAALVRSAYALGRNEQLKLLLEQDRMSDLARVLAYHRYFQRDRQQRIVGLNAELQALAELGEQDPGAAAGTAGRARQAAGRRGGAGRAASRAGQAGQFAGQQLSRPQCTAESIGARRKKHGGPARAPAQADGAIAKADDETSQARHAPVASPRPTPPFRWVR